MWLALGTGAEKGADAFVGPAREGTLRVRSKTDVMVAQAAYLGTFDGTALTAGAFDAAATIARLGPSIIRPPA